MYNNVSRVSALRSNVMLRKTDTLSGNWETFTSLRFVNFLVVFLFFNYISIPYFRRYNVQWYTAPLEIQRMILFLLQIGVKDLKLKLGGLIVASLESASTVRQMSHVSEKPTRCIIHKQV